MSKAIDDQLGRIEDRVQQWPDQGQDDLYQQLAPDQIGNSLAELQSIYEELKVATERLKN